LQSEINKAYFKKGLRKKKYTIFLFVDRPLLRIDSRLSCWEIERLLWTFIIMKRNLSPTSKIQQRMTNTMLMAAHKAANECVAMEVSFP
jgi:hypothetical protein